MLLPLLVLVLVLPDLVPAALTWPVEGPLYAALAARLNLAALLFGMLVPDLVLTCVVVLIENRTRFLAAYLAFPVLRVIDAYLALRTFVPGMMRRSDGRWVSPNRREAAGPRPVGELPVLVADQLDRSPRAALRARAVHAVSGGEAAVGIDPADTDAMPA